MYWFSSSSMLLYLMKSELQILGSSTDEKYDVPKNIQFFQDKLSDELYALYNRLLQHVYEQTESDLISAILEQGLPQANNRSLDSLIRFLFNFWDNFKSNFVFGKLKDQFFRQLFYHMNEKLFNTLLNRQELCGCGNGVRIKMAISSIEEWLSKIDTNLTVYWRKELAPIRQAAVVLVMNKSSLAEESIRQDVCPSLNATQLIHLLNMYNPDEYDSETVHPGVIASLDVDSRDTLHLDENFSYPLDVNFGHVASLELNNVLIPASILERPGFMFLSGEGVN